MTLFALDRTCNAAIDHGLEPMLEDLRESVLRHVFADEYGGTEAAVEAFDQARPRLNVLAGLLPPRSDFRGADISTGLGFLPALLARRGTTVVATEARPAIASFAVSQGVCVHPYRIGRDQAPFQPGSLDFLVFAEVLEHLKLGPSTVLAELAGLLREGGRLLLTTPNVARLHHLEMLAAGENFLEPFPADLPYGQDPTDHLEHVREYSIRETVDAIESAGLAVEAVLMTGWGVGGYDPLPNPFMNEIIVVDARK